MFVFFCIYIYIYVCVLLYIYIYVCVLVPWVNSFRSWMCFSFTVTVMCFSLTVTLTFPVAGYR